jgi:hypothetical protein
MMTIAVVEPRAVPHPEGLIIELTSGTPAVAAEAAGWYAGQRLAAYRAAGSTRAGHYTDTDSPVAALAACHFATAGALVLAERDQALRPQGDGQDLIVERLYRFERRAYRLLGSYQARTQGHDQGQGQGQGQQGQGKDAERARARADSAPVLLAVWWEPRPGTEPDLDRWYAEEHIPGLLAVPGWLRISRYELVAGPGPRYLAVHDLAEVSAMGSPGHRAATDTPWRTKVIAQREQYERRVFTRPPAQAPAPSTGQPTTGGTA